MQVRYQAALRPDIREHNHLSLRKGGDNSLGLENLQDFFEFCNHLANQLTGLGGIVFLIIARQLELCAANRVTLIVQQAANLTDGQHVLTLVVATIASSLYRR